jgi:hypothetical protein
LYFSFGWYYLKDVFLELFFRPAPLYGNWGTTNCRTILLQTQSRQENIPEDEAGFDYWRRYAAANEWQSIMVPVKNGPS